MKIPDKIKIGGHWFSIEYKSEKEDRYANRGTSLLWENRIILQKDVGLSRQIATLFHEIIHEIDYQYEIALSERDVSTLAEGIYQVLVDNNFLKEK